MKRYTKKAYVFAAILSLVLYSIGIITGIYIQKQSQNSVEARLEQIQRSIENTQLEYLYINSLGEKISCDSFKILVDETTNNVWQIGDELVKLESESNNEKFVELKKEYSLLSIRAWILNNYFKNKCNSDDKVILYFYSIPCDQCIIQGKILDDLRENELKGKLKVFVLDINVEEPMVELVKKTYKINGTPSIVVENKTFYGLVEKNKILSSV
ncbi:MAG: hypothetical protein QXM68_01385 [Candidatus Aenigmatarchaeota archaeon]|nr:hypothetical protein [Candidatus Aenigmarchaeota archaeon]